MKPLRPFASEGAVSQIPLFAMKIPAGPPAQAEDYIEERIDLTQYLTPHPDTSFLVKVEGESMIDAGINPGDLLIVERGVEAKNGDIVVALIGNEFTVKRFRRFRGNLWLVPANREYREEAERHDNFSVWGIVKYSIHKF